MTRSPRGRWEGLAARAPRARSLTATAQDFGPAVKTRLECLKLRMDVVDKKKTKLEDEAREKKEEEEKNKKGRER